MATPLHWMSPRDMYCLLERLGKNSMKFMPLSVCGDGFYFTQLVAFFSGIDNKFTIEPNEKMTTNKCSKALLLKLGKCRLHLAWG